jgi:hypothetical protein
MYVPHEMTRYVWDIATVVHTDIHVGSILLQRVITVTVGVVQAWIHSTVDNTLDILYTYNLYTTSLTSTSRSHA